MKKSTVYDDPLIVNQTFPSTKIMIRKSDFPHIMNYYETKYLIFL